MADRNCFQVAELGRMLAKRIASMAINGATDAALRAHQHLLAQVRVCEQVRYRDL